MKNLWVVLLLIGGFSLAIGCNDEEEPAPAQPSNKEEVKPSGTLVLNVEGMT